MLQEFVKLYQGTHIIFTRECLHDGCIQHDSQLWNCIKLFRMCEKIWLINKIRQSLNEVEFWISNIFVSILAYLFFWNLKTTNMHLNGFLFRCYRNLSLLQCKLWINFIIHTLIYIQKVYEDKFSVHIQIFVAILWSFSRNSPLK